MIEAGVIGWYGHGNVGDELLAYSITEAIHREVPGLRLTLYAGQAGHDWPVAEVCPAFLPFNPWLSIRGLASLARHTLRSRARWAILANRAKLLVVGGGSLFHDRRPGNLPMWHRLLSAHKARGCRVVLYGVGVDEVAPGRQQSMRDAILKLADAVSVRDTRSYALVSAVLGEGRATLAADPVFNCPLLGHPPSPRARRGELRIGLNLRPRYGEPAEVVAVEGVRLASTILDQFEARVTFIPMWQKDLDIGLQIASALTENRRGRFEVLPHDPYALQQHLGVYDHLDAVVGMRFHTLLLAATSAIPVVGLAYDPKVSALMEDLGLTGYGLTVAPGSGSGIDISETVSGLDRLIAELPHLREQVKERVKTLRSRERANMEALRRVGDCLAEDTRQ